MQSIDFSGTTPDPKPKRTEGMVLIIGAGLVMVFAIVRDAAQWVHRWQAQSAIIELERHRDDAKLSK